MKLVIVESPTKIKKLEEFLDSSFVVKASVGHIRDLPKSNKKAIDIENGFKPSYEISPKKQHIVDELAKLVKKASEVYLATDPDREGEAISWHLKEELNIKTYKRTAFNEITKEAVLYSINNPRQIDDNLVKAQEARRVLDRLVGYDLSGIIWKKVRYGLSAGRVQSPALRIIMEREREIRAFIPVTYFKISGVFKHKNGNLNLLCEIEPSQKEEAKNIEEKALSGNWSIKSVNQTEVKRSPKAPFTTSTLQQAASSYLGFAPKRTMSAAQKLYEKGFITYMRTDSTTLSTEALRDISAFIEKKYGKDSLELHTYKSKSKNAQEAHEAVRPTHASSSSAGTTDDEKKLYKLIWARTIASQMRDAKMLRTKVIANIEKSTIPDFSTTGSIITYPGWMAVDPDLDSEENKLPNINEGDTLKVISIENEQKETQPPNRYSEAGLIKELDKRDIGRPATYAAIISTLEERNYVEKINKALVPTDTGDVVSSFL
jgi:DNA topoisomerase-1